MEILYILIPLSVVLVFFIGVAFWWSLKNGQFDDMEGPAYRVLLDDDDRAEISGNKQVGKDKKIDGIDLGQTDNTKKCP